MSEWGSGERGTKVKGNGGKNRQPFIQLPDRLLILSLLTFAAIFCPGSILSYNHPFTRYNDFTMGGRTADPTDPYSWSTCILSTLFTMLPLLLIEIFTPSQG